MESLIKERSCLVGVMNTKEERSLIMGRVSTFNGLASQIRTQNRIRGVFLSLCYTNLL